jgi:hypothetical protein
LDSLCSSFSLSPSKVYFVFGGVPGFLPWQSPENSFSWFLHLQYSRVECPYEEFLSTYGKILINSFSLRTDRFARIFTILDQEYLIDDNPVR